MGQAIKKNKVEYINTFIILEKDEIIIDKQLKK